MKIAIVLCAFAAAVFAEQCLDTKLNSLDIKDFTSNHRLMTNFAECFINKGHCTREAEEFKALIPGAIKDKCAKCCPDQKKKIQICIDTYRKELPQVWSQIYEFYDAGHQHQKDLEEFLNTKY